MGVNWTKKKLVALKWLGAGPAVLLYLIFMKNIKVFENGIMEGLILSFIFTLIPSIIILLVYWPVTKKQE